MNDSTKKEIFYETVLNKNLNILFWDDGAHDQYKILFTEIEKGFKKYSWNTRVVTSKEEAIKLALTEQYDAVVLDLLENKKPVGLEMLKELRMKKPFLPIIIFTIAPEMNYVQSAMRGDVSYYLTKPTRSYHDVIRAIEVAIEREKTKERLIHDRYYASIGKLAAGVAHFIKNSLWNIRSRAQMLLEETDESDKSYELLETIKRRSDDANKVVLDLLNFARRENRKDEKKELNVVEIIDDVLKLLDHELELNNISKNKTVGDGDIWILGNEFELKEAFLNIFKNAIEAMQGEGELSIRVEPNHQKIVIRISDKGEGMSKETLENLFIPFYTTKENAVGFGLFDTQRIIQKHGGIIKPESKPGKGSTFIIEFPHIKCKGD
jgi:signal transduction histidine kinase